MNYELHPLCTLFPRMEGAEFEALKNDIKANGLRNPIVMHEGRILDGGNRYRACIESGTPPETMEYSGNNLVSFVLSANLHRRHMSTGQQAAIVASATDWAKSQPVGRPIKGEALHHLNTVAERAATSGATTRTQKDADKLVKENPTLAKEVMAGRKSLYRAVQEIKPTPVPAVQDDEAPVVSYPQTKIDSNEVQELREQIADLQAELKRVTADNEMMGRVFDADDQIKAAMDEAKRQRAIAENAERTLAAKNGEYIERARAVTTWQNKCKKLEKELAKATA